MRKMELNRIRIGALAVLSLASALSCFSGCRRSHLEAGRAYAAENNLNEAQHEYYMAIYEDEEAGEAHLELAQMMENFPEYLPLTVWHYRMALKFKMIDELRKMKIRKALESCERQLCEELSARQKGREQQTDGVKIELLEQHARKQAKWLEELRRENAIFRKRLEEYSK